MITEAARDYYEKDNWNVIPIDRDRKGPVVCVGLTQSFFNHK